ncbi:MAG: SAM-dependent methyltransferase [Acidobacteria bacterium]|nr:SAM-dependent methyltransferase [Acidobacteriota bacterium]MCL5287301.1 SAM-dependent methyltransferase [Acidobacteriota bacterium]
MTAATQTPLAKILAARIRERGPITFADYMAECLYHPEHGYYSRAESQRFADYYTSVDVHPIFGRLLARQLAEMWERCGRPAEFTIVEAGAGVGRLAAHVLDFAARALPGFYSALRYVAVEQSAARRATHALGLVTHIAAGRASSAAELPANIPVGCILSNELLDALPVHRILREHGELREIYVGLDGDRFCDQVGPLSSPALEEYFSGQGIVLLDGQQAEAGLAAAAWMEDAARRLSCGYLLTIDYGREARELCDARHLRGTLLAYTRHRAGEDFYAAPGEQDLTAHVNFTALDLAGRASGLARLGLVSQSHFLLALGRANEFADLYDEGQSEAERVRARLLLKTLIFPEGMGETFSVLIHSKGVADVSLTGLAPL